MVLSLEADLLNARAAEELGGLYALINLVGGFAARPLARTTEETWDRMLDLNLKSAFLATSAALEHMPGGGRIVNVGTSAVTNVGPRTCRLRCLEGRAHDPNPELGERVEGTSHKGGRRSADRYRRSAQRRAMPNADHSSWLVPEEVAQVILFLAPGAGSVVTGNLIALEK